MFYNFVYFTIIGTLSITNTITSTSTVTGTSYSTDMLIRQIYNRCRLQRA